MTNEVQSLLVIGGGHAAGQLLDSVRQEGFTGNIKLISEEGMLPYQRPHLSKLYLSGELATEKLLYRPEKFYQENQIEVLLNTRVESIDRDKRLVQLGDGQQLPYHKLALTTGARVRKLELPGSNVKGVHYLRSIADTDSIREDLESAKKVVLLGGGFLGLEAASVITSMGKSATVLEVQSRVMANAVAPEVSAYYEKLHSENGVSIQCGNAVSSINVEQDRISGVTCDNGEVHNADLLIISVGIRPNEELASAAGLECDNGICVNEYAQTSDADIVAAGDCTQHPNGFLQRNLRLESVHNAVEQAKTAAASICGKQRLYKQVPWFWSDQYRSRLQMVGVPQDKDERVIRGELEQGRFSVLFFRNGKLSACHAVNRPADYMSCRKILENNIPLSAEQAASMTFDLAALVPSQTRLAFQKREQQAASTV